jgi:chorismate mutase / prephenate dehydratase
VNGKADSSARERLVVGYQGGPGAFSHIAARRHFEQRARAVEHVGFKDFPSMLEALKEGKVDYALLPIENSIAGSINESYDLLTSMDLFLVGEEIQRVEHCLIALESIAPTELVRVYSHPVALAQCRRFLASLPGCHAEAYHDTAEAVAYVKQLGDRAHGAIASEEAARLHGLPVIGRDIADVPENYTRMVVVAREPESFPTDVPCRTSLIFGTKHEQGALARSINVLAGRGLNLTKLESRPRLGTPWEYHFYLDIEGNQAEPNVAEALDELRSVTEELRVLGSYPIRTT